MQQLVAVVDERTTMVCLRAAGQVQPVGGKFDTLMGDLDSPPFHAHCRSIVVPWMPGFVSDTRAEAAAEIAKRPPKEKRFGPDGYGGSLPPPAPTGGPGPIVPTGPSAGGYVPIDAGAVDLTALPNPVGWMLDQGLDDATLRAMMGQVGADGLPEVLSAEAAKKIGGVHIYRGVQPIPSKSASDMVHEFGYGKIDFVGRGVKGNGFYFAEGGDEAAKYAGSEGRVIHAVIRSDAKVVNERALASSLHSGSGYGSDEYQAATKKINDMARAGQDGTDEYREAMKEWRAAGDREDWRKAIMADNGRGALSQGWDVIHFNRDGIDQYVVLNRTAVYFVEE